MSVKIEVNEIEVPILINIYSERVKLKEIELESLKSTLANLIKHHKANPTIIEVDKPIEKYDTDWTLQEKIDFILGERSMTTSEVVDKLFDLEPDNYKDRAKVIQAVSVVFSKNSKGSNAHYLKTKGKGKGFHYKINKK